MLVIEGAGERTDGAIGGRYRLIEPLEQGGMGTVWRARDTTLGRLVAIKQLHATAQDMDTARQRFAHEARIAAALRSPHIVQIFDYGWHEGAPYLVMELLQGQSLAARLARQGRLDATTTAELIVQIARALSAAHAEGVIHRDLKPGNVFLCGEGAALSVKLLDFGIAKVTDATAALSAVPMTKSGTILGTPRYMSPEQLRCKTVDARADLWSLAVIAFECMCGRRPFEGDSLADLIMAISGDPIVVPSRWVEVPAGFDAWFRRGVCRDPAGRFPSAQQMASSLAALVAGEPAPDEAALRLPVSDKDGARGALEALLHNDPAKEMGQQARHHDVVSGTWEEPRHNGLAEGIAGEVYQNDVVSGTWEEPPGLAESSEAAAWNPISGIVHRDGAVAEHDDAVAERDGAVAEHDDAIAEHDGAVSAYGETLADNSVQSASDSEAVAQEVVSQEAIARESVSPAQESPAQESVGHGAALVARPKRGRSWLPWAAVCLATGGMLALGDALLSERPTVEQAAERPEPSARVPTELSVSVPTQSSNSAKPTTEKTKPAAVGEFKLVRGDSYAFSVPVSWRAVELPIKTVAVAYRAPAQTDNEANGVIPGIKLVVEPWGGTLSEYVDLGLDNMQDMGKVHHQQVTRAGEHPAIEVELSFHKVSKPYRSLKRVAVVNGMGYVFSCDGPINDFDAIRATCQRITASLRIHSK